MRSERETWAIVLAGGSGERLSSMTRSGEGTHVPKQFWRFGTRDSLLERTLRRAQGIVPADRIVPVVLEDHRRWWEPALSRLPAGNIVVQPRNRGTGLALLHAAIRLAERDRDAVLLVLPSDHGVEDESVLQAALARLEREVSHVPRHVVLLGARAAHAETSYGWIQAGPRSHGAARSVTAFVEKPGPVRAMRLLGAGALWNTFILGATARALVRICRESHGWLGRYHDRIGDGSDSAMMARLYDELPILDFGRHVLSESTRWLRVLELPPCGWTDLGTPDRVEAWIAGRPPRPRHAADRGTAGKAGRAGPSRRDASWHPRASGARRGEEGPVSTTP